MSLKSKIQDMIEIMKFWKSLSFNLSSHNFTINGYYIPENSSLFIPPHFDNIDGLFYRVSFGAVTIKSNKVYTTLKDTFKGCSGATLNLEFETKYITDFRGAFSQVVRNTGVKAINTPLNMYGTKQNGYLDAFEGNASLEEVRFVEESIPYNIWDLNFSSSIKLSEESLLSIANGCETPPDDIPYEECGYIVFPSTVLESMPQYIKDIFIKKRVELA